MIVGVAAPLKASDATSTSPVVAPVGVVIVMLVALLALFGEVLRYCGAYVWYSVSVNVQVCAAGFSTTIALPPRALAEVAKYEPVPR